MKKSLIALAFGTLGLGIAEFVMMGILPDVARDLQISIPTAGQYTHHHKLCDTQSEGTECQCNKTLLHTKLNLIPVTFLPYFI